MTVAEGTELWRPSPERVQASELARYQRWLAQHRGVTLGDYRALHAWSVEHLEDFWASLWDFFGVRASRRSRSSAGTKFGSAAYSRAGRRMNRVSSADERTATISTALIQASLLGRPARRYPSHSTRQACHAKVSPCHAVTM